MQQGSTAEIDGALDHGSGDIAIQQTSARRASLAALMLGLLTVAAIVTGALLLQAVGGSSGRDIGRSAGDPALARAMPLLVTAELLKIATAICQFIVVNAASGTRGMRRTIVLILGASGAVLIGSSGVVGLYAVAAAVPQAGPLASALAFAAVALTGAWALGFLRTAELPFRRWLLVVGIAFGVLALGSLIFAPLAMLVGLLSIGWWFGLSRAFASKR